MSVIARRWIVSTGELWLPDGSPTSKPDPETEDWVVLAEDYDALADQLRGAVEAAREQIKALIMAQSAAGYVETAGWALLLDEIDKLPTPGGQ
jgi:hypothetical protein